LISTDQIFAGLIFRRIALNFHFAAHNFLLAAGAWLEDSSKGRALPNNINDRLYESCNLHSAASQQYRFSRN
jgi:hypothetical protein